MRRMSRLEKAIVQEMERIKHKAQSQNTKPNRFKSMSSSRTIKNSVSNLNSSLWEHQTLKSRIKRKRDKFHVTYRQSKPKRSLISSRNSQNSSKSRFAGKNLVQKNFKNLALNLTQKTGNKFFPGCRKGSLPSSRILTRKPKSNFTTQSIRNSLRGSKRSIRDGSKNQNSRKHSSRGKMKASKAKSKIQHILRSSSTRSLMKQNLHDLVSNIQHGLGRFKNQNHKLGISKQIRSSKSSMRLTEQHSSNNQGQ